MEYGSGVWLKGQTNLVDKLDRADQQAARRFGGHFRTTPGAAVMVENDMFLTSVRFNHRAKKTAIKVFTKPNDHLVRVIVQQQIKAQRDTDKVWRGGRRYAGLPRGHRRAIELMKGKVKEWKKVKQVQKAYKKEKKWEKRVREDIGIVVNKWNEEEEKRQRERKENCGEIIVYSDGSKWEDSEGGVGVVRLNEWGKAIIQREFRMGKEMEIFDLELVGLKKALDVVLMVVGKGKESITTVIICTNSQAAINRVTIREPKEGEAIVHKIRYNINALAQRNVKTELEWVKGHAGINGNELADQAARNGAKKKRSIDRDSYISLSWLKAEARKDAVAEWEGDFTKSKTKGKSFMLSPVRRYYVKFPPTERKNKTTISKLRMGHVECSVYLYRFKKTNSCKCECEEGVQTVAHLLAQCVMGGEAREAASIEVNTSSVDELLTTPKGVEWTLKIWAEVLQSKAELGWLRREKENDEGEWGWRELER